MTAPTLKTRHDEPVWVCLHCGRRWASGRRAR